MTTRARPVFWLCLAAFAIKLIFYLLDPNPGFHFGDSASYVATALIKWIPPDRSFTYGFLLRPLIIPAHSLTPIVLLQVAASAVAATLTGFLLPRYFYAKFPLALCFTCLCSIEPLQLMEERFIMTETLATFFFALLVWVCFCYIRSNSIWLLLLAQCIGIVLVSLRFSFLPLVIVLPLGAFLNGPRAWKFFIAALLLSQALLFGYRHLYGHLAHTKPGYLSRDGDFLIADMAPLITPADFPI